MDIPDQNRETTVYALLSQVTDSKLLKEGTERATRLAEQAISLAVRAPRLRDPWPQLAAYRLAHLLMRSGQDNTLARATELFEEATRGDVLGPMPHVYFLAALSRRRAQTTNGAESEAIEEDIRNTFDRAQELARLSMAGMRGANDEPNPTLRMPVQEGIVNLLELSAYFLKLPYEPLDGMGGAYSDLGLGDGWFLVGPDPRIATVRYPYRLAMRELEEHAMVNPDAIVFRLSTEPKDTGWKTKGSGWQRASGKALRLIACLLERNDWAKLDLRDWVVGEGESNKASHFRVVCNRTRELLEAITKKPGEDLLVSATGNLPVSLDPGLKIFGAVQVEAYMRPD